MSKILPKNWPNILVSYAYEKFKLKFLAVNKLLFKKKRNYC